MKSSTKPANDTRGEPTDYTDGAEYNPDAAAAELAMADNARCFNWADALIERGVIGESQREDAERALLAILRAGTSSGPRDDERRDLVRRMLVASANPTPTQTAVEQRRVALVRVLRPRCWKGAETLRSLNRIDPAFHCATRELYERQLDPGDLMFAARLSVAFGAFGDRTLGDSVKKFKLASREQSRKPRKR